MVARIVQRSAGMMGNRRILFDGYGGGSPPRPTRLELWRVDSPKCWMPVAVARRWHGATGIVVTTGYGASMPPAFPAQGAISLADDSAADNAEVGGLISTWPTARQPVRTRRAASSQNPGGYGDWCPDHEVSDSFLPTQTRHARLVLTCPRMPGHSKLTGSDLRAEAYE
jgi:hypothetical protein